uniref:Uncharacterized protein n=1 Tax=Anguilla anguilla TaxID=7936 RepID=A0A0E9S2S0_ANGAN
MAALSDVVLSFQEAVIYLSMTAVSSGCMHHRKWF